MIAEELACRRGGRLLFSELNLSIDPGQAIWLKGPNGQGKTSLLRILAGLAQSDSGRIPRRAPLSYVGHQSGLKDDLTVLESLRFLVQLQQGCAPDSDLKAALNVFGMAPKSQAPVRTLSQGQRRRVALSRLAMASQVKLWLLDEPFDALDAQGMEVVCRLMAAHRNAGGAIILTSHVPFELTSVQALDLSQWAGKR